MLNIIIGGLMTYAGFYGSSHYSPVLFVEGMFLLNYGLISIGGRKNKSLNYQ